MKLLTSFLLLASLSYADQTGSLSGSVRTREGAPLPHLVLMVAGPAGNHPIVTGLEGVQRLDVTLRDHEHVRRRLRIDVVECHDVLVFVHLLRRDLAGGDAAKETSIVTHARIIR